MDTAYKTTLELDKVLARAVQLCACQETKEMMQALEPAPTIEDERYDLAQTNAINALLIKNGSPRFGSVREVRRIVAHARKGGILSMGELLEIAATLRNFSGLSQWYGLSEHEMLPTDDLFFSLAPQPVLEKQISESILSPEEMADTASVTRIPSAPSSITSSATPPPTNSCRMPLFRCAMAAMLCRSAPSTAVRWAVLSMTFPLPVQRCLWNRRLSWKPMLASCSIVPRKRRRSSAFW